MTTESWHLYWPLQEADVQFLGIGTLSQVKQNTTCFEFIGPERQKERLRPCVANITVNLRGCNLLQQWNTQINTPAVPESHFSVKNIINKDHQSFWLYKDTK